MRSTLRSWRIPMLMFHHIEPAPLTPPAVFRDSYIEPAEFAAQLDLLQNLGLRTVTYARACELEAAGEAPRRSVVLTFDDGCRCFAEHAAPALTERGMTATVFAVSGRLGGTNDWDRATGERIERLLDVAALRRLHEQGFEIASHGQTHLDLAGADDRTQERELVESRRELETGLGVPVRTFCYPYGHLDLRARSAAKSAGYLGAASIHGQPLANPRDPFALARMIVGPGESPFELRLKARGWYPLWSRLPRLGLLRALRRSAPAARER